MPRRRPTTVRNRPHHLTYPQISEIRSSNPNSFEIANENGTLDLLYLEEITVCVLATRSSPEELRERRLISENSLWWPGCDVRFTDTQWDAFLAISAGESRVGWDRYQIDAGSTSLLPAGSLVGPYQLGTFVSWNTLMRDRYPSMWDWRYADRNRMTRVQIPDEPTLLSHADFSTIFDSPPTFTGFYRINGQTTDTEGTNMPNIELTSTQLSRLAQDTDWYHVAALHNTDTLVALWNEQQAINEIMAERGTARHPRGVLLHNAAQASEIRVERWLSGESFWYPPLGWAESARGMGRTARERCSDEARRGDVDRTRNLQNQTRIETEGRLLSEMIGTPLKLDEIPRDAQIRRVKSDDPNLTTILQGVFQYFRNNADGRYSSSTMMRIQRAIDGGTRTSCVIVDRPFSFDEVTEVKSGGTLGAGIEFDDKLILCVGHPYRHMGIGSLLLATSRTRPTWVNRSNKEGQIFLLQNDWIQTAISANGALRFQHVDALQGDDL